MWIFLIELIEKTDIHVKTPETTLSIGMAPPEDSRIANLNDDDDDIYTDDFDEDDEDDNPFGDDFEDGYSDEDYSKFDDY
jgi:hypothetical protein